MDHSVLMVLDNVGAGTVSGTAEFSSNDANTLLHLYLMNQVSLHRPEQPRLKQITGKAADQERITQFSEQSVMTGFFTINDSETKIRPVGFHKNLRSSRLFSEGSTLSTSFNLI